VSKSQSIEDIILRDETRGMSLLRPHLPSDFVTDAAQFVLQHPGKAFIVTGFYILAAKAPETDGPPGSIVLARALRQIGFDVVFVTDKWSSKVMKALAPRQPIVEFPMASHDDSATFSKELLETEQPSIVIAVERAGFTNDGTYRNRKDDDISEYNAKTDYLFEQHPISIGIGDGGNEIGMGLVSEVILNQDDFEATPSMTTTTKLIISACSNWGAYGLVAGLSLLTQEDLLPTCDDVQRIVELAVKSGAVDSSSCQFEARVDGRSLEAELGCIADLRSLLRGQGV